MRENLENVNILEGIFQKGFRLNPLIVDVPGAAMTVNANSPPVLHIDPAQALTLTLPAVSKGLFFLILHGDTGNFDITVSSPVNRAGVAGATTVATISQNECGFVYSDGVTWHAGVMKQT